MFSFISIQKEKNRKEKKKNMKITMAVTESVSLTSIDLFWLILSGSVKIQKKYKNKNQIRTESLGFYFFIKCIESSDTQLLCIDTY